MNVIAFKSSQKPYSIGFAIICVYGSLAGLQSMGSQKVGHDWATKHTQHTPHLYLFFCQWTFILLPCLGYYKQCCNEHWGTHVSFNSGFLGVYAQQWDCWVIINPLIFNFTTYYLAKYDPIFKAYFIFVKYILWLIVFCIFNIVFQRVYPLLYIFFFT